MTHCQLENIQFGFFDDDNVRTTGQLEHPINWIPFIWRKVDEHLLAIGFHSPDPVYPDLSDGRSTNISWPSDFTVQIQLAKIDRTLSWRCVYLFKAAEQLESTCLFDCTLFTLHKVQTGLSVFFHLCKLEAVGSCWRIAFRAKQKMYRGIDSSNEDQSTMFRRVII